MTTSPHPLASSCILASSASLPALQPMPSALDSPRDVLRLRRQRSARERETETAWERDNPDLSLSLSVSLSHATATAKKSESESERERADHEDESETASLRLALSAAQRTIAAQAQRLRSQDERIAELERLLLSLSQRALTTQDDPPLALQIDPHTPLSQSSLCETPFTQPHTHNAHTTQEAHNALLHSATAPPGMLSLFTHSHNTHNALTQHSHTPHSASSHTTQLSHTTAEGSPDSRASSGVPDSLSVCSALSAATQPHTHTHSHTQSSLSQDAVAPPSLSVSPRLLSSDHTAPSHNAHKAHSAGARRSQSKLSSSRSKLGRALSAASLSLSLNLPSQHQEHQQEQYQEQQVSSCVSHNHYHAAQLALTAPSHNASQAASWDSLDSLSTHARTIELSYPTPYDVTSKLLFDWTEHARKHTNAPLPHLFVLHDNGVLGESAARHARTHGNNMRVLIETHARTDLAKFVWGEIVFSGALSALRPLSLSRSRSRPVHSERERETYTEREGEEDEEEEEVRGESVFVVAALRAVQGDLRHFPRRRSVGATDISEIDLGTSSLGTSSPGTSSSSVESVPLRTPEDVSRFFAGCAGRVDVVLSPLCDRTPSAVPAQRKGEREGEEEERRWHPYWDGQRKLAPQFRSNGAGYLRLGDDMSRLGAAFLSLDAAQSFLADPPRRERDSLSLSRSVSQSVSQSQSKTTREKERDRDRDRDRERRGLSASLRSLVRQERESDENENDCERETERDGETKTAKGENNREITPNEVLARISQSLEALDQSSKWTDRVERLKAVQSDCEAAGRSLDLLVSQNSSFANTLLSRLTDVLGKQSNPQVQYAALSCIVSLRVAACLSLSPSLSIAWRGLALELFYALRANNRAVSESAARTLTALHCGGASSVVPLSWAAAACLCADALSGARGTSSAVAMQSKKKVSAANTSKVVQWLQSAASDDLTQYTRVLSSVSADKEVLSCNPSSAEGEAVATCLSLCGTALAHREEATREVSLSLCGHLLALATLLSTRTLVCNTSKLRDALSQCVSAEEVFAVLGASPAHNALLSLSLSQKALRRVCTHAAQALAACCSSSHSLSLSLPRSEASPRAAPAQRETKRQTESESALSDLWCESKMLLKRVPHSEIEWRRATQIIQGAHSHITELHSLAESHSISVGSLLSVLLPFCEETSSSDQAACVSVSQEHSQLTHALQTLPSLSAHRESVERLRVALRDIRALVRVKIADQADLAQAVAAVDTLLLCMNEMHRVRQSDTVRYSGMCALVEELERLN